MCVNCTYCHSKIGLLTLDFLLLLHVLLLVLLLIVMFPLMCFIADTLLASLHADVNQADEYGQTPLKAATDNGKKDTAEVLRSLGGRM